MKKLVFLILIMTTSSLIAFAQQADLIFSHKFHVEDVEASCTDCHEVGESQLATDNLLPTKPSCFNCHDEETACATCHVSKEKAAVVPRITDYIAKFSHQQHSGEEFNCATCHKNVAKSEQAADTDLPSMQSCSECHPVSSDENYCYQCHAAGEDLTPADHMLAWDKGHGIASYTDMNSCEACHQENSCLACHQGDNLDHKVHRLNFVNNHGMYAKGNKDNCLTCHEEFSSCVACHQQRMVMPRTHARANWSNKTTGGSHALAAKLDLDSCISCHSDAAGDPVCVQCHK